MNEDLHRRKVLTGLETIVGTSSKVDSISDYDDFLTESNLLFLKHILSSVGLRLSNLTQRTYEEELPFWDNYHLVDLAINLPFLKSGPGEEKLRYLIQHSIQGNLAESLSSKNPTDRFAQYNASVLSELDKYVLDSWLSLDRSSRYQASKNPENPFHMEFKAWSRDFRKEFAIGNISECCIAVNGDSEKAKYKHVLLDYFLDLSINVIKLKTIDKEGNANRMGQIYLVPLLSQGRLNKRQKVMSNEQFGLVLGVTSVELANEYRDNLDLVPPIMNALSAEGGYMGELGFSSLFVGHRFSLFGNYLTQRKKDIDALTMKLKQYRSSARDKKRELKNKSLKAGKINSQIESITFDLKTLQDVRSNLYVASKIRAEKLGLNLQPKKYYGTDYLDILGTGYDGFMDFSSPEFTAEGFYMESQKSLRFMETKIAALSNKYKQKEAYYYSD